MRPLVDNNSSSSELQEDEASQNIAANTQLAAGRNRSTSLQILRVLKSDGRSHHKTFLVRTNALETANITENINVSAHSNGEPSSVQFTQINADMGQSYLRVIKVFDNQEIQNLQWLKNDLLIRQKFVGDNPSIVKCYGAAKYNQEMLFIDNDNIIHHYPQGYTMLVYDHCDQGDLLNFVLNKQAQLEKCGGNLIRKLYSQILSGLYKLHKESEVSLLNLNLTKVLMGRDEAPYFYDFSSARHMNSPLTIFDFKVNKMSKTEKMFLAPEILNLELMLPLVGEKIDIFSLGVMLFITLFGRPPFQAALQNDQFYQYLFSQNPMMRDKFFRIHRGLNFDEDLKSLLLDMLQPNPLKRPTVREILQNKWFNITTTATTSENYTFN